MDAKKVSGRNNNKVGESKPTYGMSLCYDLLPVQYTELTHQLRKFLVFWFLGIVLQEFRIQPDFRRESFSSCRTEFRFLNWLNCGLWNLGQFFVQKRYKHRPWMCLISWWIVKAVCQETLKFSPVHQDNVWKVNIVK